MLNYLKKFAMDILPSVAATIIGAYIVNHYIATKPGGDVPAAAVSTAAPKAADAKPAQIANLPAAGVKAKGISEKAIMEKTASERPTVVEKAQEKPEAKAEAKSEPKADVKPVEAPAETASIPARHAPAPRDKVRVILPSPVQAVTTPVAPAVALAPVPAPPADIPVTRPLDLRAEVMGQPAREHTSVADDVLSAAKSMFHAVLPK